MSLNAGELAANMVEAMKGVFDEKWSEIKEYAETEAKKLAESFVMVEKLKLLRQIDEEESELQFNIQKNASRTVLLTIEGLGILP